MKYPKIQSPWKRDRATGKFLKDWSRPDIEYLANSQWQFSEKLDGTNIRVIINSVSTTIKGRTDAAQIPAHLLEKLESIFLTDKVTYESVSEYFERSFLDLVLYGEGVGPKIQKGGGDLSPEPNFVLFDIKVGGSRWLEQEDVTKFAEAFDLLRAPLLGQGTIWDAAARVNTGFYTSLPCSKPQHWAEGLVLRPMMEMKTRYGRVITKLKTVDFRK